MNQSLRKYIIEREHGLCALCSRQGTEIHHEPPKKMGGDKKADKKERLVLLCDTCHEMRTGRIKCKDDEQRIMKIRIMEYLRKVEQDGPVTG